MTSSLQQPNEPQNSQPYPDQHQHSQQLYHSQSQQEKQLHQCHRRAPSWVYHTLPLDSVADVNYWPPRNTLASFDWSRPTHQFYAANPIKDNKNDSDNGLMYEECQKEDKEDESLRLTFSPSFQQARSRLDYTYHTNLVLNRQYLQDAILRRVVESCLVSTSSSTTWTTTDGSTDDSTSGEEKEESLEIADANHSSGKKGCFDNVTRTAITADTLSTALRHDHQFLPNDSLTTRRKNRPWIVFTAGAMGVGKGYVLMQLQRNRLLNVDAFVKIDPDLIKAELPEMAGYLQHDRDTAATLLHRESTQMADVLFEHALCMHYPILVDGSLRDVDYYTTLLQRIRREYGVYKLAIVLVVADPDVIVQRAHVRAQLSGRVVPEHLLHESIRQVPQSVAALSHLVDVVHTIANNEGRPLELVSSLYSSRMDDNGSATTQTTSSPPTWDEFAQSWNDDDALVTEENYIAADDNGPTATVVDDSTVNSSNESALAARISHLSVTNATHAVGARPQHATRRRQSVAVCTSMPIVDMAQAMTCSISHAVANSIWQRSYPNVCARCTISCDFATPCGVCVHGCHECACSICQKQANEETPHRPAAAARRFTTI